MMRIIVTFVLLLMLGSVGMANNVRVSRDVKIDPTKIESGDIATIDFAIVWDNSWRDDYNWDAVYIFLKFKKANESEWKHVNLMSEGNGHSVSAGFTSWVAQTSPENNKAQGIFVYRSTNGTGEARTEVKLKWSYVQNGLTKSNFIAGEVECAATCIEMVYVPRGLFCIGDGLSANSLRTQYRPILPEWDLIRNDGKIKFSTDGDMASEEYKAYPPENVANRVNETRSGVKTNAWCGKTSPNNFTIDFGRKRKIRYVGVSGILGLPGNRPNVWSVLGSKDGEAPWVILRNGFTQDDWAITPHSYPVARALKLDETKIDSFRFYRIEMQAGGIPMANNIAMTEVDVESRTEYAYVVDKQTPIVMNVTTELSADNDKATWTGTLNATYPTGYEGFYTMKYEISQEQYMRFLNKLQYKQQKMRTIGDQLDNLGPGAYVYGGVARRNGIIVGQRADGAIVFTNDFNRSNPYAQTDDGKNIACNYLSPADMLAYADWTGLRPLSEMEYEKMARPPFPYKPKLREWAWNSNTAADLRLPAKNSYTNAGKSDEQLMVNGGVKPNVNAGNNLEGPVRSGAFATNAINQKEAGASYWGVLELTGNLAEIYYTVNQPGREFDYVQAAHGDGILLPESNPLMGNTDMAVAYWPQTENAFILKGGSFKTEKTAELAVSDRTFGTYFVGKGMNVKDSTVSFRLGHSYSNLLTETQRQPCTTYLKLANKQLSSAPNVAKDSVCNGQAYTIHGSALLASSSTSGQETTDVLLKVFGTTDYIWYISEDAGVSWKIIAGEEGQHLTYSNFYNDDVVMKEVRFKRRTVTPVFESETNPIILAVINNNFSINRFQDTINQSNHTLGFLVETKSLSNFMWSWKKPGTSPVVLQGDMKNSRWDYFFAERDNFDNISDSTHTLICDMTVLNKCTRREELSVYVARRETSTQTNAIVIGGSNPKTKCGALMKDKRDGELYGTVMIENPQLKTKQCWMAENLRYKMAGMYFPTADPKGKDPTGKKRGGMYNWSATVISTACPEGWRLSSNADINALNAALNTDGTNRVGEKLRAGNYWANSPANKTVMGTNSSGFGLIGAGHYSNNGGYQTNAYLITSDYVYTYEGYYYYISYNDLAGLVTPTYWTRNCSWCSYYSVNSAVHYYMPIRCILK